MPGNPAALLTKAVAALAPMQHSVQTGFFLLLLIVVSVCDLKRREIPNGLQLAIGMLTFLCFSPINLLGILGALPYLAAALFFYSGNGIGGGDIKLAAATGMVLGLPASLVSSMLGLSLFMVYGTVQTHILRCHGQDGKIPFPLGPFLAFGSATACFMKMGGIIR